MCERRPLEAEKQRMYTPYAEPEEHLGVKLVVLEGKAGDGGWDEVWSWLLQPETHAIAEERDA